jgi:hypothetical protein
MTPFIALDSALVAGPLGLIAWGELRYARGKRAAERAWREAHVTKMQGVGTTRSLAVLPLIDWFRARSGLRGEAGARTWSRPTRTPSCWTSA